MPPALSPPQASAAPPHATPMAMRATVVRALRSATDVPIRGVLRKSGWRKLDGRHSSIQCCAQRTTGPRGATRWLAPRTCPEIVNVTWASECQESHRGGRGGSQSSNVYRGLGVGSPDATRYAGGACRADAKGAKDTLGRHHAIRAIPSEAHLSSRAAARDLSCVPRGRAIYRAVRGDPSLPLGMTAVAAERLAAEGLVLRGLGVLRVLGGLLFTLGRSTNTARPS